MRSLKYLSHTSVFIGDGVALVTAEAGEVSEKLSTFMLKVYFRIKSFFFFFFYLCLIIQAVIASSFSSCRK